MIWLGEYDIVTTFFSFHEDRTCTKKIPLMLLKDIWKMDHYVKNGEDPSFLIEVFINDEIGKFKTSLICVTNSGLTKVAQNYYLKNGSRLVKITAL